MRLLAWFAALVAAAVALKQFTTAGVLVKTPAVNAVDPGGISFGAAGNLLLADYGSGRFSELDGAGNVTRRVQIAGNAKPSNIAGDAAGTIYVTDSDNDRVDVFDPTGKQTGFFSTPGTPSGIALGAGALYVTSWDGTLTAYRLP